MLIQEKLDEHGSIKVKFTLTGKFVKETVEKHGNVDNTNVYVLGKK